ncbi:MAG: NAD(P)-dependent oxidoreductase [Clostridiales bacterium]|nr:NAD(P)-dependent oxidoreductase [Clostridiales bacterium]
MNILFIGIGEMGFGMAKNILAKNGSLTIWNRTKDKPHVNELLDVGAVFAENFEESAKSAGFICLNLTADSAVKAVSERLLLAVAPGTIITDFSTISPETAKELNSCFLDKGAFYLDCPVSGGSKGANEGSLTIMCGGDKAAYERALPLLNMCGKNIEYMGDSGLGQKAKLINQLLTWVNQAVVCEAMLLARHSSIDLAPLYKVLSTSWGRSWMLERSVEKYIIPGYYDSPSGVELMVKDFNLIMQMAEHVGCDIPIAAKAKEIYDQAMSEGLAQKDPSVVIEVMENNLRKEKTNEK